MSHRDDLWEVMGNLMLSFLKDNGLKPTDKFLDVGCGPLRGGVKIIPYLDPGNYFGFEANEILLNHAEEEIKANDLEQRSPRLYHSGAFEFEMTNEKFDVAFAQSLFPHLDLNRIIYCCVKVEEVLKPDGQFFFSFFDNPEGFENLGPVTTDKGVTTYPVIDPYHTPASFFKVIADMLGFDFEILPYDHPHGQKMGRMFSKSTVNVDTEKAEVKKPVKAPTKKPAVKKTPAKKTPAKKPAKK